MNGYLFDIEADNLYLQSKEIWIIHLKSLDRTRELTIFPFRESREESKKKYLEWHDSFGDMPNVVSFNGIGYDHWMLWRFLGISFHVGKGGVDLLDGRPCRIIDIYMLSQFVDPDRPRHALASYGEEFGNAKIDFHDFSQYSEEMLTYCKQDVNLSLEVLNVLTNKMLIMYRAFYKTEYTNQHQAPFRALQKDYYLYAAQAYTGINFNKTAAKELIEDIDKEMQSLEAEVLPQLPPRKLKEGEKKLYSMPAKPFKKDGSLSSHMLGWIEKHSGKAIDTESVEVYGTVYKIEANKLIDMKLPMEIKDGEDIKEWFMQQGWEPTFWNFKRDERGKPARNSIGEIITTSPKIQEAGKICPNLLELNGELPKKIVRFLSLRNRKSVVSGWLEHWRLEFDGRLPAEITGYTPTFRVKHSCIVNLPKASPEVVKGYEVRSLFIASEGMKYVSADAAALENRTVADGTFEFDNGEFAERILKGDSHSFNAKAFFPEETRKFDVTSPEFNKDDPEFKPFRNKSKNGGYCLNYGGSYKKLAKTLGVSTERGEVAYNNYWNANAGLKAYKEYLENEWKNKGAKKFIQAKNGALLTARSKHLLVNLSGQSLGATVITYALCLVDNKLGYLEIDSLGRPFYNYKGYVVRRLAAFHDQGDYEAPEEIAEEIGQLVVDCIRQAGVILKMKIELDGEAKVGNNAAEIH